MMVVEFSVMETESLGARIRAARKNAKLTQEKLARRCGVSHSVVSQWETGAVQAVSAQHLSAAARALGVSLDWLLGESDNDNQSPVDDAHSELIEAWDRLTTRQRAQFLEQIQAAAAHNVELLRELAD